MEEVRSHQDVVLPKLSMYYCGQLFRPCNFDLKKLNKRLLMNFEAQKAINTQRVERVKYFESNSKYRFTLIYSEMQKCNVIKKNTAKNIILL
jgi:hypothetical protein